MLESFESTTSFRAYCDNTLEISFSPCEEIWIPESRKLLPVESGIQKCFLVNLESWLEIQLWNTAQRIRNPSNDWNQESKFHWQESGIQSLESRIRSLESTIQDVLGFCYLTIGLNPLGCVFPLTGQEIWKRSFFYEKGKQIQVDYWSNQERGHLCLFWQLTISSVLIPSWQRFDSSVRRMRCIFPLSNLKRLIHLYDSVELTTSQRPSLSIEHSFGGAIYPFIAAKKRIFRAYTSQVWVWSIWKHC